MKYCLRRSRSESRSLELEDLGGEGVVIRYVKAILTGKGYIVSHVDKKINEEGSTWCQEFEIRSKLEIQKGSRGNVTELVEINQSNYRPVKLQTWNEARDAYTDHHPFA